MKKSTLQLSAEPDIAGDPLHELIRNVAWLYASTARCCRLI
ncbi:hypothetical protein [Symbiopectobacterium sp. RP]